MSDKIDKTTVWMPYSEYLALEELKARRTPEELDRMGYFMWNNFSYDGYEEYKKKRDVQIQEREEDSNRG